MNSNEQFYDGREQTYIKHAFLRRYLEVLSIKVLHAGWNTFNYVDGFAGPWEIRDEQNYSDSSFDVATSLLSGVKVFCENRIPGKKIKIRFVLCEKKHQPAEQLRDYARQNDHLEIHVFEGKFEDNLEDINRCIPGGFTFTFIDPTSWVVRTMDLCGFLKKRQGEFLFNFMTEEISRHWENEIVAGQFGELVGVPNWIETVKHLPAGSGGELYVLELLIKAFRSRNVAKYLPNFSILKPLANREKMRLILGTNNPEGVKAFRDVHSKIEQEEFRKREKAKTAHSGQNFLFSEDDFLHHEQDQRGIGCKRYRDLSQVYISDLLPNFNEMIRFSELALKVMEKFPMQEKHVKDLCNEMKSHGLLNFELTKNARKPSNDTQIFGKSMSQ